jgi:hypothetical protein
LHKSRFTEEQISAILKEWERGGDSRDLCRRYGISHASLSRWKMKFGREAAIGAREAEAALQHSHQARMQWQSAGRKLRRLREELGLSFTQVEKESAWIAERFHNQNLIVWHLTLSNIEAGTHIPNVYQLYALSLIYRRSVADVLSFYGLG